MNIEIITTEDFDRKMNVDWQKVLDEILSEGVKDVYDYITSPGEGVKSGQSPNGGAPVDTGKLISNHYIRDGFLEKSIGNDTDYLVFVINGTSRTPPNNYPQRAFDELKSKYLDLIISDVIGKLDLK